MYPIDILDRDRQRGIGQHPERHEPRPERPVLVVQRRFLHDLFGFGGGHGAGDGFFEDGVHAVLVAGGFFGDGLCALLFGGDGGEGFGLVGTFRTPGDLLCVLGEVQMTQRENVHRASYRTHIRSTHS